MSNTIKLKRGSGSDPSASDLAVGEVALRTDNASLFTKKDDGNIAEIGAAAGISDGDKGDITVSNSGATFTIDSGVIDNANIASNAAIAGSKISPSFTDNVTITNAAPALVLVDSDHNSDFNIQASGGVLAFNDSTNSATRLSITSSGVLTTNACPVLDPIAGSINITGGTSGGRIAVQGTTTSATTNIGEQFYFWGTNKVAGLIAKSGTDTSNKDDGSLHFYTSSTGTVTERLVINADGHIDVAGNIDMPDDAKIKLGDGSDLQIYHNGSHSFVQDVGTGSLKLAGEDVQVVNAGNTAVLAQFISGGRNEFRFDNSTKLETTSTGVDITGVTVDDGATHNGDVLFQSNSGNIFFDKSENTLIFSDNNFAKFGGSGDLKIYHNASHSYLEHTGTGNIHLRGNGTDQIKIQAKGGEQSIICLSDAAVELYYDNSKKFETTSGGATLTGSLIATANVEAQNNMHVGDGKKYLAGNSNDLQIYHDGSNSRIHDSGTGVLAISGSEVHIQNAAQSENCAKFIQDGAVELYYNNEKVFYTRGDGVQVQNVNGDGVLYVVGSEGNEAIVKLHADDGDDNADKFQIVSHADNYFAIQNFASGSFENNLKAFGNGSVTLYYDNVSRIDTTAYGVNIIGDARWGDNRKATFGNDGTDLQIYHDGSNSIIDSLTGDFYFRNRQASNGRFIFETAIGEVGLLANHNGSVDLYYDNSKKLETKSDGIDVTGEVQCDSLDVDGGFNIDGSQITYDASVNIMKFTDNAELRFGSGNDLRISHNGTSNIIQAASNDLNIRMVSQENAIVARQNGAVELYYDNSKKFETVSDGNKAHGHYFADDGNKIQLGTSQDLQIYHDGTHSYVDNSTGLLLIQDTSGIYLRTDDLRLQSAGGSETYATLTKDGAVALNFDNSQKFETTSGGISVTGNLDVSAGIDVTGASSFNGFITLSSTHNRIIFTDTNDNPDYMVDSNGGHFLVYDSTNNQDKIKIFSDGHIDIHGNVDFISGGIDVTGNTTFGGDTFIPDGEYHHIGTGNDMYVGHFGGTNIVASAQGSLEVQMNSSEKAINCVQNAQVELYYNGSKKFETTSSGVNVTGALSVNGSALASGKTLQVVSSTLSSTNSVSISGNTFQDIGLSASITPSSSSNKILVIYSVHTNGPTGYRSAQRLLRGSTVICQGDSDGNRARVATAQGNIQSDNSHMTNLTMNFLDSPSTTSSVTYKVQGHVESNGTMYINRAADTGDGFSKYRPVSTITLMEIAA